jgi:Sec-independent protein translocase protein TatA
MLNLDPAKLMVVLVVGLIVLGPDKLPKLARQLGAAWGDLRRLRQRLEDEVRGAFPEMPSTHEVARAVRSPIALLDRLADAHEREKAATGAGIPQSNGAQNGATSAGVEGGGSASELATNGSHHLEDGAAGVTAREAGADGQGNGSGPGGSGWHLLGDPVGTLADDPSMN